MKFVKMSVGLFALFAVTCSCAFAESLEAKFEKRYIAWRSWVAKNEFRSTFTACREYYDIIALGVPVVPLMIKKMEEHFEDFHLSTAVGIVSKRNFGKEEWPAEKLGDSITASKMYVSWWREGRFHTETRFKELYAQWCKLNDERKADDAEKVYRQIVNLGLPVMPCLVGVVDENAEFVAAVSELSDGALPKNARPEECKSWWEKNKERFTLPPLTPSDEGSSQSKSAGKTEASSLPQSVNGMGARPAKEQAR